MALKLADKTTTRRFERGEDLGSYPTEPERKRPVRERDGAWVELRVALSKEEDARINDSTGFERLATDDGMLLRGKAFGDRTVFEILAVGWSLEAGTPKIEDYLALDATDADWVDECLSVAVQMARGEIEGKDVSPERADPPNSGLASSAAGDDPPPID